MAREPDDRKRRTRGHVIADLSHNHLERFIFEEGHAAHRLVPDYGYDVAMQTFDADGRVEPGLVHWQLKASEAWVVTRESVAFDLDVRDYTLWIAERQPVILMLYDVAKRRGYWLDVQEYFRAPRTPRPRPDSKTVRVRIPVAQTVTRRAIRLIHARKQDALSRFTLRVIS